MGLIEPLAIAAALPSGVLPLGSSLLLWVVPVVGVLSMAAFGLWQALPRRQRSPRALTLAHSAAA